MRNPYDFDRIPGGSSGGNAAALAARLAPLALGGDTGGSVRVPAALTGTFGFRPTTGRYSIEGVVPLTPIVDTLGPMARDIRNLALADAVLAGTDAELEAATLAELNRRDAERGVSPLVFSLALPALGHADEALAALQAAFDEHNAAMFYISREPFVDPIRSRPGFREILRALRLPPGASA